MDNYPEPKRKSAQIVKALHLLMESKSAQETAAASIVATAETDAEKLLAKAFAYSNRILAEDCGREAGFMLPQSDEVRRFLVELLDKPFGEDFPADAVKELLELV